MFLEYHTVQDSGSGQLYNFARLTSASFTYLSVNENIIILNCSHFFCLGDKAFTQSNNNIDFNKIQNAIVHIPDSVQTSVYWYWISGNIFKEGVLKDLEAMKKVGINRAFIGMIGLDNVPYGKVKMFSDEWC